MGASLVVTVIGNDRPGIVERLSEVVLTLKASGIDDVFNFPWLERPDSKALERAERLSFLGRSALLVR